MSLVDPSPAIKQYARYCLISLLNKKLASGTNLFFNNFVETIFFLNDYNLHNIYNQFKQTEYERNLFSLKGSTNSSKRMEIYNLFLAHLKDDNKFNLQSKLVTEVLGSVVEGVLPLTESGYIILDTLSVLASKDIKMKATQIQLIQDSSAFENEEEKMIQVEYI